MVPVLRLIRFGNVIVSFAGTVVGALAAAGAGIGLGTRGGGFFLIIGLAALSTACVTAAGNVLNDVLDVETDRVNHPDRPLVTGQWTVPRARQLTIGLFVTGVLVAVPVVLRAWLVGVILAVAIAALLGYEFRLKASGLAGNLTVAMLTGLVFLYGGAAVGNVLLLVPFAMMAFLATFSREIIKDMEDATGDAGRSTVPQRYGMPRSAMVARHAVAGAMLLSPLPLLWYLDPGSAAGIMYLGLVLAADVLFVASVYQLPGALHREQTVSKVAMTVALIAFLAVAFR